MAQADFKTFATGLQKVVRCRVRREEGKTVMAFPDGAPFDDDFIKRALGKLTPVALPGEGSTVMLKVEPWWERNIFISEITLYDDGRWAVAGYGK